MRCYPFCMWILLAALTPSALAVDFSLECPNPTTYARPDVVKRWDPTKSADFQANCDLVPVPEDQNGCARHIAWVPPETAPRHQDQLMLMLPGELQKPYQFEIIQGTAAYTGYRVLGLSHAQRIHVTDFCAATGPDVDTCFRGVRDEILYGNDAANTVLGVDRVDPIDSLVGRTVSALEELYWDDLDADGVNDWQWDRYLVNPPDRLVPAPPTPDQLHWDRIIVVGFSISTVDAMLLAQYHSLAGVVYLDGPEDDSPDLHVFEQPYATPACVHFGSYHVGRNEAPIINATWDHTGMGLVEYDADQPWVDWPVGASRVYTYQAASGSCVSPPHGSMARDGCMPSDATSGLPAGLGYGRPHLFEPYVYLFCAAGTFDPNTCTAYSDQSRAPGPRL